MLIATDFSDLNALRKQLRQRRRELTADQQRNNSALICEEAAKIAKLQSGKPIGLYNTFDGEPNLSSLISTVGENSWLPVVSAEGIGMQFAQGTLTNTNQFGIAEPQTTSIVSIDQLAVIFVPLVGYDKHCNRIGMGKGFYDRALAGRGSKTKLVGIAHSCQQVNALTREPWDVPLDCVVTETGIVYPPG